DYYCHSTDSSVYHRVF
nr:immunoglobulin light chain junction region [Macaca mulatta]MOW01288.1 immunoglobulin light chain junction region [Macaca mulatta]